MGKKTNPKLPEQIDIRGRLVTFKDDNYHSRLAMVNEKSFEVEAFIDILTNARYQVVGFFPTIPMIRVSYFVSDIPILDDEIDKTLIKYLSGYLETEYHARYSEITGYLWTTEYAKIGGHDLLEELENYVGKYLYLRIKVDKK